MKVFVTGGTGFVGTNLVRRLAAGGHDLVVLSRSRSGLADGGRVCFVKGDPQQPGAWGDEAAGADAVINLAGASIFQRWTKSAKKQIMESRILTTRNVVEAMGRGSSSGRVLLSTSAVGYYGFRGDEKIDEESTPGSDFLAEVTRKWEDEAVRAESSGVRVVLMRFGVVFGPDGGALGQMLPLFRKGLGGRLGSGRQWFSWIHHHDLERAMEYLLEQPEAAGPFNLTAPNPVTNADFTKALGRALKRPAFLPAPGFMIKLALGEFGSVLLEGQKVTPHRLNRLGFEFDFPTIEKALSDLVK